MHIICVTPIEAGVYNDHSAEHIIAPPNGWAYIPDDFPLPPTFPRLGSLEAEELTYIKEVVDGNGDVRFEQYTMLTVTTMTEGSLPDPKPIPEEGATEQDYLAALERFGVK